MPHYPRPFFKKSHKSWYVEINGHQHRLGPDEREAHRRYHALMAKADVPEPPPPPESSALTVLEVLDRYLAWVEVHRSPDTYRWYNDRLQAFLDFKSNKELLVKDMRPFHVQEWVDAMPHKSGTRRNYVRSVKRAFRWAEEQGIVDRSPVAYLKKPAAGRRDNVISPELHQRLLALTKPQCFRDLLNFSYHTGARCSESLALEARHLDLEHHRVVFPLSEEKMERAPRIIYLNKEAEKIVGRLAKVYPYGKLFKNTRGRDWHPDATNLRFRVLARKVGVKVCLTDYRHSLATRLLAAGVDGLTVSIILGHSDTTTLSKVYQHLNHESRYLLEALNKG